MPQARGTKMLSILGTGSGAAVALGGASDLMSSVIELGQAMLPASVWTSIAAAATVSPVTIPVPLIFGGIVLGAYVVSQLGERRAQREEREDAERLETQLADIGAQLGKLLERQASANEASHPLDAALLLDSLPEEFRARTRDLAGLLFTRVEFGKEADRARAIGEAIGDPLLDRLVTNLFTATRDAAGDSPLRAAVVEDFAALAKAREASLRQSLAQVLHSPEVTLPVSVAIPGEAPAAARRLHFSERLVPRLLGRETEMAELREFRDSAFREDGPRIRWWLWHGPGGMGKSRLALEWLYESLAVWDGGFLPRGFPDRMDAWRPERPTIFIVDYAATHAESTRRAITAMLRNEAEFDHPVRVLLLERVYDHTLPWARVLWRRTDDEGALMQGHAWQADPKRLAEPRALGALAMAPFVDLFQLAYLNLKGRMPADRDLAAARAFFETEEFAKRRLRPLYAGLTALALTDRGPEGMERWRPYELEHYVLEHEERLWRDQVEATQCDVNAVFLATLRGRLSPAEFQRLRSRHLAPCIQNPGPERCRRVASHTEPDDPAGDYNGIEPDLVGEAFVLARLKGTLYPDEDGDAATIRQCSRDLFDQALSAIGDFRVTPEFLVRSIPVALPDPELRRFLLDRVDRMPEPALEVLVREAAAADGPIRADVLAVLGHREDLLSQYALGSQLRQREELVTQSERVRHQSTAYKSPDRQSLDQILSAIVEGEAAYVRGDWMTAHSRFLSATEASAILVAQYPDDPETLRVSGVSAVNLGRTKVSEGAIADGLALLGEGLAALRIVRSLVGDTPNALRDEAVALSSLGELIQSQGNPAGAIAHFEESLALRYEVRKLVANSPAVLRDELTALDRLSRLYLELRDLSKAVQYLHQFLGLARQQRILLGDTQGPLRDEAVALRRFGDLFLAKADYRQAASYFEESLALARRVRDLTDGTPAALREEAIVLERLADVMIAQGQHSEAERLLDEVLALRRRVRTLVGDVPDSLRDLLASFCRIVRLPRNADQRRLAFRSEMMDIARGLVRDHPDVPQFRQDLAVVEHLLALHDHPPTSDNPPA
jgi:tetratricopeptide (TPR) repeat protein